MFSTYSLKTMAPPSISCYFYVFGDEKNLSAPLEKTLMNNNEFQKTIFASHRLFNKGSVQSFLNGSECHVIKDLVKTFVCCVY